MSSIILRNVQVIKEGQIRVKVLSDLSFALFGGAQFSDLLGKYFSGQGRSDTFFSDDNGNAAMDQPKVGASFSANHPGRAKPFLVSEEESKSPGK
jgi:hypothetical protein